MLNLLNAYGDPTRRWESLETTARNSRCLEEARCI